MKRDRPLEILGESERKKTRNRPRVTGSRRDLKQQRRNELEEMLVARSGCIRNFSETHRGDERFVDLLESVFHICGDVIIKQLINLHGDCVAAAQRVKVLVQLGLIRCDVYAAAFGGSMNLATAKLAELRRLASYAGINAYSIKLEHGRRHSLTLQELQKACQPLVYLDPFLYKSMQARKKMEMWSTLRRLECLPGEDRLIEERLNGHLMARRGTMDIRRAVDVFKLPLGLFTRGGSTIPLAYRPSLALHASNIYRDSQNLERIDPESVTTRLADYVERESAARAYVTR